jgi:uncharacterized membrane protein
MEEITNFDPKDIEENKVLAAISYLGILVLIPLLMKKESKFVKEHAKQGLVLFIAEIVLWIVDLIFAFIPVLGLIISILIWIVLVAIGIVSIIGLIYALQGKFWKMPLVYDWAQSFKL